MSIEPSYPVLAGLSDVLEDAVKEGVFPGASFLVALEGKVVHQSFHGTLSDQPSTPVGLSTVYDVASLTKPMAMTAALMLLEAKGVFDTEWSVGRRIEEFRKGEKCALKTVHLLAHRSGLPAWKPYFEKVGTRGLGDTSRTNAYPPSVKEYIRRLAASEPLERQIGEWTYSDLDFIVLEEFFELETGEGLDRFLQTELYGPLGMDSTFFIRLPAGRMPANMTVAPVTDRVTGVVDDENCRCMGGVSGHAGLFSRCEDLHRLASEFLLGFSGKSRLFPAEIIKKYWTRPMEGPPGTHALGWDTPSKEGSSSGSHFSAGSVGHLGFTGCSIWIDPLRMLEVILLSNRVCPSRKNERIKALRPVIHDLVFKVLSV